jgi:hypothetical protein
MATRADLWEDSPAARDVLLADSKRREEQARKEALEAKNAPYVMRDYFKQDSTPAPEEKPWWKVWGGKRTRRSRRKRTRRSRKN